ncbi:MAG: EAL domain-containing protein, partial [Steroidobacteraceae bacterium]
RLPSRPTARDDEGENETSGVEMVRLEFMPEPPVVNAAPAAPVPAEAPLPAPKPPRPARVLPAPQPRASRPAEPPSQARVPAAATATPAPAPAPVPAAAPAAAPAAPIAAASPGATSDAGLVLEVLPFAKLRAGGQARRFQVQARSSAAQRDPAALDAFVLQRLLAWLAAHRGKWNSQPTSFTVNLSIATLEDERFAQKIAAALNANGIAAETLGFEIAEPLCAQRRAQVERFIGQCEKLGSWVVIDDFSFDSQVLPLLRSKALRLVKIDPRLTSAALRDKFSQALVVATVQAAKVLGIHCSAKKVDSQASRQWLTAIGCDFAQGAALALPVPLEALAKPAEPKTASARQVD